MIADRDETLKALALEMAEALGREGGDRSVALMQRFGLLGEPAAAGAAAPAPQDQRIGIWEPRGAAEPGVYDRAEALKSQWQYWADVPTLQPKGQKKRVVLLGESVAYGYYYAPRFTPAQVLEHLLSDVLGAEVEVVDLARAGILPGSLAALAGRSLALRPDLFVIFAGNNWLPLDPPPPHSLGSSLEASVLSRHGVRGYRELRERNILTQLGNPLRQHLQRLAMAVPVVLLVPEFDLADWPLAPEVDVPWLSGDGNRRWWEHRAAAEAALAAGSAGEVDRARVLAREMLELDGETAGSGWVLLAECERQSGNLDAARVARERARDARLWDNNRQGTRTHAAIQELLRGFAAHDRFSVIDLPKVYAAWLGGELPDRRLFLDLCHMSSLGIRIAMAAAAREIVRRLGDGGSPLPTLEELVAQAPAPAPRVEAEAAFAAAIFNAHFEQTGAPLTFFCREAARSPEVAQVMRAALEIQVRRSPFWASEAANRVFPELLTTQLKNQLLVPGRQQFDAALLAAIAGALEAEGLPAQSFLDGLRRDERSLSEVPQDLLSPYNAPSMVDRNARWQTRYFHRAYSPVSRFPWVCRAPHEVAFELCCRRTAEVAAPCQVLLNGAPLSEIAPGAAWTSFRFVAAPAQVQAGVNWLEIRWSFDLPRGEDQIAQAADDLENGRPYTLVPVFAEIHSLTAALV